jgi:hypothetical protein
MTGTRWKMESVRNRCFITRNTKLIPIFPENPRQNTGKEYHNIPTNN